MYTTSLFRYRSCHSTATLLYYITNLMREGKYKPNRPQSCRPIYVQITSFVFAPNATSPTEVVGVHSDVPYTLFICIIYLFIFFTSPITLIDPTVLLPIHMFSKKSYTKGHKPSWCIKLLLKRAFIRRRALSTIHVPCTIIHSPIKKIYN